MCTRQLHLKERTASISHVEKVVRHEAAVGQCNRLSYPPFVHSDVIAGTQPMKTVRANLHCFGL